MHALRICFIAACVTIAGCAGPSLLDSQRAIESTKPLAEASDERVHVSIENVIVRNGAGSWARDAEWDEYLIKVRSLSGEPLEVREVVLFDALDQRVEARTDRSGLTDGTREIERRYGESGRLVRIRGGNGWVAAGVTSAGVATAIGLSAPAGFAGMAMAAAAASAVVSVGAAFVAAGVVRAVKNARVDNEIQRRRSVLPVALSRGAEATVDLFFPITPLSTRAQVVYADLESEHRVDISTGALLAALDTESATKLVRRVEPEFPADARRQGVSEGHVIANLTLNSRGRVTDVAILRSKPSRVFEHEAKQAFRQWSYNESLDSTRVVQERLDFKR